MGLSVTDTLSLVKNGYTMAEIKEVNTIISTDTENGSNILELAKKVKFSDLKQAIEIFSPASSDTTSENESKDDDPEGAASAQGENQNTADDDKDPKAEDVDYKQLYEKEKNLRETLQKKKHSEDTSGKEDVKSDFEIALEAATSILN